MSKPKLVVFTGAGMSAESGINTFRDAGGLWEQYDVMDVCSEQALYKNRKLVFDFFNDVHRAYGKVKPNDGHLAIAELEDVFDVQIITQNVDDLHEQAGSTKVMHLHGNLRYKRDEITGELFPWGDEDLNHQGQLRPHVVMFGEMPENYDLACDLCAEADFALIVGTSLQVYPAAFLAYEFTCNTRFLVDPNPQPSNGLVNIAEPATTGCRKVADHLRNMI